MMMFSEYQQHGLLVEGLVILFKLLGRIHALAAAYGSNWLGRRSAEIWGQLVTPPFIYALTTDSRYVQLLTGVGLPFRPAAFVLGNFEIQYALR